MNRLCPLFVSLVTLVALCTVAVGVPHTCYSTSSPYRYYSAYTNYADVKITGTDFSLPGCEPKKFYYLSRHGIRYPTTTSVDFQRARMARIHTLAVNNMEKGTMCSEDQVDIKVWEFRMHSHLSGQLADMGRQQSLETGRRWAQRFPSLVGQPYSSSRYSFKHTYISRTHETAKSLANGMFNKSVLRAPELTRAPPPSHQDFEMDFTPSGHCDSVLLYYTCCDKYKKAIQEYYHKENQQHDFGQGHLVSGMVININHRLGLSSSTLSLHDMQAMYQTCIFEHSLFTTSPWCATFSDQDIKIMEYWNDLTYYYEFGYARNQAVIYEQTCDLVKDFMGYFKDTSSTLTGKIRVGHEDTLIPLFTRLGVFNETLKPIASNMDQQNHRQWRISLLASFGANIAFVEYKCGSESKIRAFHNEGPLALPMCPASGCKKNDFMHSVLGTFADSCSFSNICDSDGTIIG